MDFYPRPPRGGRRRKGCLTCARVHISIHALREEGDILISASRFQAYNFYPRPPRGGRQYVGKRISPEYLISIHALREEGDGLFHHRFANLFNFYPRPPRGGRLLTLVQISPIKLFLSTPSARRATYSRWRRLRYCRISIHALREEGDRLPRKPSPADCYFYPRPPRGGRPAEVGRLVLAMIFLSTPSARRATSPVCTRAAVCANFYPRPPRGGRRFRYLSRTSGRLFLSTPSARRATFSRSIRQYT